MLGNVLKWWFKLEINLLLNQNFYEYLIITVYFNTRDVVMNTFRLVGCVIAILLFDMIT